jgi:Peptidase family S41
MSRVAGLVCGIVLASTVPASEQLPVVPPPAAAQADTAVHWRQLFERDINYLEGLIPTRYIYAVHPGGAAWNAQFEGALAQARREAAMVRDFGSYRSVLQHFVARFEDAHFSAYFNLASRHLRWPGFTLAYRGGGYFVDRSALPTVRAGAEVTACDGRSMHAWMDQLAQYLGGPPGRETTRASLAQRLLVDGGNPLFARPQSCRVGGSDVQLAWTSAPSSGPNAVTEPERMTSTTLTDESITFNDFHDNGAWVRIGTMMPMSEDIAAQFRALIDHAPSLRDKDFVVIDVRGNAGGTYNWFMAFLRAFYGKDYAGYYARARLEIGDVMLVVSSTGTDDPGFSAETNRIQIPPDPTDAAIGEPKVHQLPNGLRLLSYRPVVERIRYPRRAPPNPVRGRVYLLTDYGCGSACLSFVDEMMRFPGVIQIGAETHIDRRSGGWPEGFELPSGLATIRMGRSVRDGRRRGENEAWIPTLRFDGDITDTEAVKRWILEDVIANERGPRN